VRPEGIGKLKKIHSPDRVSNPRSFGLCSRTNIKTYLKRITRAQHRKGRIRSTSQTSEDDRVNDEMNYIDIYIF
jgi:hypothetical protein